MVNPSFKDFCQKAKKGNLIPVYKEIVADTQTPVSTFLKLFHSQKKKNKYAYLLESVEGGENIGRYSFLSSDPMMVFRYQSGEGVIEDLRSKKKEKVTGDPLEILRGLLKKFKYVQTPDLPRFVGGAVGYFSYDAVQYFEPIPIPEEDDLKLPEAYFVFTDTLVIFDHVNHTIKIMAHAYLDGRPLKTIYDQALKKIEILSKKFTSAASLDVSEESNQAAKIAFKSNVTPKRFKESVNKAKAYIRAGDVIQVVVSQRFSTPFHQDPFLLYRCLRGVNPSPYMFYLQFPEATLVGSSPELMVRCEGRRVEIRPIAGTRPRGETEEKDLSLEKELLADPKERAEHIMLVDLARNDIGRVCETASVEVKDLMVVEKYSHVMHIVSSVFGKLKKGKDSLDLLRATFPAGTVSGAPKVRAMQIIEELENCKRGPYAGSVGYISYSGNFDSCITIRTLVVKDEKVFIQAGAGIVADSVPSKEFDETVNKAKALLKAVEMVKKKG